MNKRGGIVEIRGFKGLITAIFIFCCLVTGFTVFPGFVAMHCWNLLTPYITDMPTMNLLHGVMLWGIIFLLWYAFNGKPFALHFGCNRTMSEEEIKSMIERIQKEQEEFENKKDEE